MAYALATEWHSTVVGGKACALHTHERVVLERPGRGSTVYTLSGLCFCPCLHVLRLGGLRPDAWCHRSVLLTGRVCHAHAN